MVLQHQPRMIPVAISRLSWIGLEAVCPKAKPIARFCSADSCNGASNRGDQLGNASTANWFGRIGAYKSCKSEMKSRRSLAVKQLIPILTWDDLRLEHAHRSTVEN